MDGMIQALTTMSWLQPLPRAPCLLLYRVNEDMEAFGESLAESEHTLGQANDPRPAATVIVLAVRRQRPLPTTLIARTAPRFSTAKNQSSLRINQEWAGVRR